MRTLGILSFVTALIAMFVLIDMQLSAIDKLAKQAASTFGQGIAIRILEVEYRPSPEMRFATNYRLKVAFPNGEHEDWYVPEGTQPYNFLAENQPIANATITVSYRETSVTGRHIGGMFAYLDFSRPPPGSGK